MTKRDVLQFDNSQLYNLFNQFFPLLGKMAKESQDITHFKKSLGAWITEAGTETTPQEAKERLYLLIENDGTEVSELSTGTNFAVNTIHLFRAFLRKELSEAVSPDLFIDLFYQFKILTTRWGLVRIKVC